MNPLLSKISHDGDVYQFTLSQINVSLANAIRRTILSDIPTVVMNTERKANKESDCVIHVNTTRLHNEILKQRLSCIPIHMKELDILPKEYILELDIQNDSESMIIVTTENFRIKNKTTDKYITMEETRKIFPMNPKTNMYIDFARIRPKIGDSIPGEQIKLTAEFSLQTAKDSSMYNVVSKCTYGNTIDVEKVSKMWDQQETKLRELDTSKSDIDFQKKNFYLLDAQRHFIPDSFDFTIQSVGVFENVEIVKKSCLVLQNKLIDLIEQIDSQLIQINHSETTIEHCFDILLENEDYTLGKVIEYILYEKYYQTEKIMTYCGFKKFHPHDTQSVIRVAYLENADKQLVSQHLRIACVEANTIFANIHKMF
jgi:DNA-directed RNA polymerase alpha subunit/DNA-directed RNA polymerase subunit L